jgi:nucleoside-diphosphate-sugar epimerase
MKGQSQPPDCRYLENRVTRHIIALVRNKERALERFSAYKGRADLRFLVQDGWEPTTSVSDGFKRTIEYYFKTFPITYGT